MNKKKSFVDSILIYLSILVVMIVFILAIFLYSSYSILDNEIKDSSEAFLENYSNDLQNNIDNLDQALINVAAQGEDLAKLKSYNENVRSLASISLKNHMHELLSRKYVADIIVIYDHEHDVWVDAITTGFDYHTKNALRDHTAKALDNNIKSFEWDFINIFSNSYIFKMLNANNRTIAIYRDVNKLLEGGAIAEDIVNRSIILSNDEEMIGNIWGEDIEELWVGANLKEFKASDYYVMNENIADYQLKMYCYTHKASIFQQIHTSMLVIAVVVFITVLFILFILLFVREEITNPMRVVVDAIDSIRSGDYQNRIEGDFNTKEFEKLQHTTNKMVDEIVELKIQTYERKIELHDMELKAIRLQIKPHFYLNALTTISSLSGLNRNEEIRIYIDALSKNIRYMFQVGFHTVPIKKEIQHIENYIEMQDLNYPGSVFHMIDLPKELESWEIPQMLVHTIIENAYKHAVSIDDVLTILIKISKQVYQGEEMLLIEIEDDGKGYPKEVLDYMSGVTKWTSDNGTGIGLWSTKRIIELMYERDELILLDNILPHGSRTRIYIPKEEKSELGNELDVKEHRKNEIQ